MMFLLVAQIAIAFFSGAAQRTLAVLWVHYAERNAKLASFNVGILQGVAYLIGASIALSSEPGALWCALAFVIGYGVGSLAGIELKQRFLV